VFRLRALRPVSEQTKNSPRMWARDPCFRLFARPCGPNHLILSLMMMSNNIWLNFSRFAVAVSWKQLSSRCSRLASPRELVRGLHVPQFEYSFINNHNLDIFCQSLSWLPVYVQRTHIFCLLEFSADEWLWIRNRMISSYSKSMVCTDEPSLLSIHSETASSTEDSSAGRSVRFSGRPLVRDEGLRSWNLLCRPLSGPINVQ
jgi:hypothetical protein